MIAAIFSLN